MSHGGSLAGEKWDEIYSQWCQATPEAKAELIEWFEQMGADWDKDLDLQDEEDTAFGAHFVLSIAAAGWHSASLVLVNEELERKITDKCTVAEVVETSPSDGAVDCSSVAASAINWLYSLARRFLGLEGNVNIPAANDTPTSAPVEQKKPTVYTWSDDPFPRIKLFTGEIIGDQGPIWERKNGVFVQVES